MKRMAFYLILIMVFSAAYQSAVATKFLNSKSPGFEIDTVYDDDVFISAFKIKFDSKINGDLFSFSYEMVQTDTVAGNFMAFANSVQNLGAVTGSYRAFARSMSCNGAIGRNLLLFGQEISVGPQAHVGRGADLFGENIICQGTIDGDLSISAKNAVVSGIIGGNLTFNGDSLTINPNTTIAGNLNYSSPNRASIGEGSAISGEVTWKRDEEQKPEKEEGNAWTTLTWLISVRGYIIFSSVLWLIILILSIIPVPWWLISIFLWFTLAVSGNILIVLNKRRAWATEKILKDRLFPSMGLGFIIFFLVPVVTLILFMTAVAAPLAMILIMLFGIAMFIGGIYASLFFGRLLCKMMGAGSANAPGNLCFTIGMTIMVVLSFIPVLGYIIMMIILMTGLGALIQSYTRAGQTDTASASS